MFNLHQEHASVFFQSFYNTVLIPLRNHNLYPIHYIIFDAYFRLFTAPSFEAKLHIVQSHGLPFSLLRQCQKNKTCIKAAAPSPDGESSLHLSSLCRLSLLRISCGPTAYAESEKNTFLRRDSGRRGDGATRRGIKPRIADERERPRKFRGLCHIWFCSGADHPRSTRSNSPRRLTSPERAGSRAANRVPPWAAATACSRYFLGSSLNR